MELSQAILQRRSIRAYEDRPISVETLEEIIEAGTWAPSAVNLQPWYFVVIQDKNQLQRLTSIMARVSQKIESGLKERFSKHPEVVKETIHFLRLLGNAPVCILAFQYKPEYPKTDSTVIQSVAVRPLKTFC